jgi:hypothetical protein
LTLLSMKSTTTTHPHQAPTVQHQLQAPFERQTPRVFQGQRE